MRIVWLLKMSAIGEGIAFLAFLIGIVLGFIVSKMIENIWVTIFSAALPMLLGVVAEIKLLINSWDNLSFERPILVAIVSLIIFLILYSVNWRLSLLWGKICFGWYKKTDSSETSVAEEKREENIKICETNTEK